MRASGLDCAAVRSVGPSLAATSPCRDPRHVAANQSGQPRRFSWTVVLASSVSTHERAAQRDVYGTRIAQLQHLGFNWCQRRRRPRVADNDPKEVGSAWSLVCSFRLRTMTGSCPGPLVDLGPPGRRVAAQPQPARFQSHCNRGLMRRLSARLPAFINFCFSAAEIAPATGALAVPAKGGSRRWSRLNCARFPPRPGETATGRPVRLTPVPSTVSTSAPSFSVSLDPRD